MGRRGKGVRRRGKGVGKKEGKGVGKKEGKKEILE